MSTQDQQDGEDPAMPSPTAHIHSPKAFLYIQRRACYRSEDGLFLDAAADAASQSSGLPAAARRRQQQVWYLPRLVSSSAVPYREGHLTYLPTCSGPAGERVWPVRERLPAHHGAAHAPGGDGRGAGAPQTRQPARQGHHHRSVRPNRVAAATTHIHIHAFSFLCSV